MPIPDAKSSWLAYVLVDDVKQAADKARSLGATVMKDKTEAPGMGAFAIITDPTGAMLGLWETKDVLTGSGTALPPRKRRRSIARLLCRA